MKQSQQSLQSTESVLSKKITASFFGSFTSSTQFPKSSNPYVAFVGRTNCGKSSLLNSLTGNPKLARSSSTPGRTQLINFFSINQKLFFVDLPGYGFSKVSSKMRCEISRITDGFLTNCSDKLILVFLLDIRVDPGKEDIQMQEWAEYNNLPVIYVFTKTDKLSSNKIAQRKKQILKKLNLLDEETILYSSLTEKGRNDLLKKINLKISEFCSC